MKPVFGILTLISILSVTLFGFLMMNHQGSHGHDGCLAAAAQGASCMEENGPLASINIHMGSLRFFGTAVSVLFALWLVLVLAILLFLSWGLEPPKTSGERPPSAKQSSLGEKLNYWLALHENSPTVQIRR